MPHTSRNSQSCGEFLRHWGLLAAGLTANAAELSFLESHRAELVGIVAQIQALLAEQQELAAARKETSLQVKDLLSRGSKIASFLRQGVKTRYGIRSEKLTEFDLIPFQTLSADSLPDDSSPGTE